MADSSHSSLLAGLEKGDIKVRNSRGSSAGAGSGDAHRYLQGRRAEIFRLEKLQEESDKAKKDKEWEDNMKARIEASDAEKAKKAEKRNKKKMKRKLAQEEQKSAKKAKTSEIETEETHKLAEIPTTKDAQGKETAKKTAADSASDSE